MPEHPPRNPRQVFVADHLWETFGVMAREMGVDRDGLVNQALFAFARQNGYLAPGQTARPTVDAPVVETSGRISKPNAAPAPLPKPAPQSLPPLPDIAAPQAVEEEPLADFDQGFGVSPAPAEPEPEPQPNVAPSWTAYSAKGDLAAQLAANDQPDVEAPASGTGLVLYAEGREVDRVSSARFLIGRGKHCDLIINSGKVSREHAAIVRDGESFFIEDLGSSNGTWFDKKRITRRKIEDGDEYFVCSEKITCRFE